MVDSDDLQLEIALDGEPTDLRVCCDFDPDPVLCTYWRTDSTPGDDPDDPGSLTR